MPEDLPVLLTPRMVVWCLDQMTDEEAGQLEDYAAAGGDPLAYIVRTSEWLIERFGLMPGTVGFRD